MFKGKNYLLLNVAFFGISFQYMLGCIHEMDTNLETKLGLRWTKYHPSRAPRSWPTIAHRVTPKDDMNMVNSSSRISGLYERLDNGLSESPNPFKSKAMTLKAQLKYNLYIN